MAGGQDIAFAHAAQVAQQRERVLIAHRHFITIGHRQGKTGALHQAGQIAQIGKRVHMRANRAGQGALAFDKGARQGPQFSLPGRAARNSPSGFSA